MKENRHVCILCKRKKTASKMLKNRSHWTCNDCLSRPLIEAYRPNHLIKVLNLYAGLGGNRKLWTGVHVTAVELNPKIAAAYASLYPEDTIIIADAHEYLIKNYFKFDVIWSSFPCQSHSRMNYWLSKEKKRAPDLKLFSEIIFLQTNFKGPWVVENVNIYYNALVEATIKIGRHLFWSNIKLSTCEVPQLRDFIKLDSREDKEAIQEWLGIFYEPNLYSSGKNYIQVFRNCVHPLIGESILKDIFNHLRAGAAE